MWRVSILWMAQILLWDALSQICVMRPWMAAEPRALLLKPFYFNTSYCAPLLTSGGMLLSTFTFEVLLIYLIILILWHFLLLLQRKIYYFLLHYNYLLTLITYKDKIFALKPYEHIQVISWLIKKWWKLIGNYSDDQSFSHFSSKNISWFQLLKYDDLLLFLLIFFCLLISVALSTFTFTA